MEKHHAERSHSTREHGNTQNRAGGQVEHHEPREEQHNTRTSPTATNTNKDRSEPQKEERQDDTTVMLRLERPGDRFVDQKSLPCENFPHDFYAEWNGDECDNESFFCFSEGINRNCCKCRPECCGQCNVLATHNDPYQACPALASKALADMRAAEARAQTNTLELILIAFGVAFILGCSAGLWGHFEERKRMAMLAGKDNKRNLRAYRDEGEADDGVYKDEPYR